MINLKITKSECMPCDLPCVGRSCKYYEVTRYYCDKCLSEETLYDFNGYQLCIECIKDQLSVIEGSEEYDY